MLQMDMRIEGSIPDGSVLCMQPDCPNVKECAVHVSVTLVRNLYLAAEYGPS